MVLLPIRGLPRALNAGASRKRARSSLVAFAVSLALAALAEPTSAQPAAQKGSGMELVRFKSAQDLYNKGDFAGALILFRDVASSTGSPNARFYIARCLRELGKLGEAYEEMTIVIREADQSSSTSERYIATRDAAASERAALASKVALLTVAFAEQPPGLTLKVGERTIDRSRLRDPIALAPGAVVVEASAPNMAPFRKELTIAAGGSETLAIVMHAAEGSEPAPSSSARKSGGGVRLAGFGVLGLGAAGFVMFAVAGAKANDKYKTVYDACGGARCVDPKSADEISAGRTLDTVANIGLVVGIAGAVGGAAMVVFGGPKEVPVSGGASTTGGWLAYSGRF